MTDISDISIQRTRTIVIDDSLDGILAAIKSLQNEYLTILSAKQPVGSFNRLDVPSRSKKIYTPKRFADNRDRLLLDFLAVCDTSCDKLSCKAGDLRLAFNTFSGLDESHISFSRLMESSASNIKKSQRSDATYYLGIRPPKGPIISTNSNL